MGQSFSPGAYAVLIVDDDALVRSEAVDLVTDAGFTAYEAANADQAIRIMERHSEIRVLFTDIEMRGSMDGLKLARAVRERWPPIAIFLTSGATKLRREDLPENGVFFTKPYAPNEVIRSLAEVARTLSAS